MNNRWAMSWASLSAAVVGLERGRKVGNLRHSRGGVSRCQAVRCLGVEGTLGPVPFLVGDTGGILVGAYDDVAHGVASAHAAHLHRAALGGGPPTLGPRDVATERGAEVPAHVPAAGHDVEGIALGVEANILAGEANGGAAGCGKEEREDEDGVAQGHHGGGVLWRGTPRSFLR